MRSSLWFLIAAVLMLAPAAAQARPRDEVMSTAFRCASLGSSRLWLDCYYGAAQPARAALGLSPAPAAQVQLSRTAPATASGPVSDSAIRDQVMSGAFGCNRLPGERQWLDCYYGAAQPMRVRLGLAPAPQAGLVPRASLVPQASLVSRTAPVRSAPPPRPAPQPGSLFGADATRVRMAAYSFDKSGSFTVTLANGQVWRQRVDDANYAHWKGPASSHVVSVSGGAFGHWRLEDEYDHVIYSVQPVR
ncbi:MAG: hypothetical protein BGN85_12220 [Alphaproteobacteria bacterium 64-11]|nr:hypothetical protein [Alphaproteobacteria bacterium]OJU08308.1 MAG: hypothetical protein BGN85_12220 [Alphaproteobacteria bacterium 64-11]